MKTQFHFCYCLLLVLFIGLTACNQTTEDTTDNQKSTNIQAPTAQQNPASATAPNQKTPSKAANKPTSANRPAMPANTPAKKDQVVFVKHTNEDGPKAKIGDFLLMHLVYTTAFDSVIYSTYKNNDNPTPFRMESKLFKGLLNNGLREMAAGDSATFYVPTDSLYDGNIPRFTTSNSFIKYTIALKKIQSSEDYLQQERKLAKEQYEIDDALIEAYLKKYKLKAEKVNGAYYVIEKSGKIKIPKKAEKVNLNYTLQTLELEKVFESSNGEMKKMPIKSQVRGFQEAIYKFHQGGKGKIIIPSRLGYGKNKRKTIPGNSILIYDFEVGSFE